MTNWISSIGQLEVGDNLGDVGVHLVQLGVLGGRLQVLAPGHCVHKFLGGKGEYFWDIESQSRLLTWGAGVGGSKTIMKYLSQFTTPAHAWFQR